MEDAIAAVRRFNRFYTRLVGALDAHFLGTSLTLPEARVLFEIAHDVDPMAARLKTALGMDAGFLSRVLARFEKRGWIVRGRGDDARRRPITLTDAGRAVFDDLDRRQHDAVAARLERLAPAQQDELVRALGQATALLDPAPDRTFRIRPFAAGDVGLIASRQSVLYRDVYGWGFGIEVNIAESSAAFLKNFKPGREQCWVAEVGGALAGSVFLTDEGGGLCRLRLLYVEAFARGRGVGAALVETCIAFAREIGYREMTLWTHTVLESARRIYAANGFEIVDIHTHTEFGEPVQSETWRLDLTKPV
jgi:DNA-binding MarR family transcriptional regulator/N-acetylglutamate synthase-like GNAT family acetyltransferase